MARRFFCRSNLLFFGHFNSKRHCRAFKEHAREEGKENLSPLCELRALRGYLRPTQSTLKCGDTRIPNTPQKSGLVKRPCNNHAQRLVLILQG
jgi:hypothetical protein